MTRNKALTALCDRSKESHLIVGLNFDAERMPKKVSPKTFMEGMAKATKPYAAGFSIRPASYTAIMDAKQFAKHCRALRKTIGNLPFIIDGNYGNTGKERMSEADYAFEQCQGDIVTLNTERDRSILDTYAKFYSQKGVLAYRSAGDARQLLMIRNVVMDETKIGIDFTANTLIPLGPGCTIVARGDNIDAHERADTLVELGKTARRENRNNHLFVELTNGILYTTKNKEAVYTNSAEQAEAWQRRLASNHNRSAT